MMSNLPMPGSADVSRSLTRRNRRLVDEAAQSAVVSATAVEGAALTAFVGLKGAEVLAGHVVDMHRRHGDVIVPMVMPILEGYGQCVGRLLGQVR